MPSRGKLGFVLRHPTFSSSVIRENRSSMRASSGASGSRKSAPAGTASVMAGLLSRILSPVAGLAVLLIPSVTRSAEPAPKACVAIQAEAPYRGSGYDHIVKLESHCQKPVKCHVASDVNPEGVDVALAPKERTEVLLWRGSPASTFKARVSCR